jgi:mannose-6-phosphate isomerase-like protein (cupin superfamily)
MTAGRVTTLEEALAAGAGGSATTLVCPVLEQRVEVVDPGERAAWTVGDRSEVLFVAFGAGALRVAGGEHRLEPETAAFLALGDEAELEADAEEPLALVVTRTPGREERPPGRPVTAGLAGAEARDAGIGREFRLLVGPEHGCSSATQFVGFIPPGRAKMHNHPYEEVAYVVDGTGVLHWHEGPSEPVERGSCIYFPRLEFHSLENLADRPLRIMGVFHPAGSPADRVEVLDY